MKITVNKPFQYDEQISVLVNGICNHFGCHIENEENVDIDPDGVGQIWYDTKRVCNKCGAYTPIDADDWSGVEVLPVRCNLKATYLWGGK